MNNSRKYISKSVYDHGNIAFAFGLRRLSAKYIGPLIEVKRISDNTITTIYPGSNGEISDATLLSLSSTSSLVVTKIYNQNTSNNFYLSIVVGSGAYIVESGVVVKQGSRLALRFPGTTGYGAAGTYNSITTVGASSISVLSYTSAKANSRGMEISGSTDSSKEERAGWIDGLCISNSTTMAFNTYTSDNSTVTKLGKFIAIGIDLNYTTQNGQAYTVVGINASTSYTFIGKWCEMVVFRNIISYTNIIDLIKIYYGIS